MFTENSQQKNPITLCPSRELDLGPLTQRHTLATTGLTRQYILQMQNYSYKRINLYNLATSTSWPILKHVIIWIVNYFDALHPAKNKIVGMQSRRYGLIIYLVPSTFWLACWSRLESTVINADIRGLSLLLQWCHSGRSLISLTSLVIYYSRCNFFS